MCVGGGGWGNVCGSDISRTNGASSVSLRHVCAWRSSGHDRYGKTLLKEKSPDIRGQVRLGLYRTLVDRRVTRPRTALCFSFSGP